MTDMETNVEELLRCSEELKSEGNDHYRARRWEDALATYRSALGRLPKLKSIPQARSPEKDSDEDESLLQRDSSGQSSNEESRKQDEVTPLTEEEAQVAKARSVLNANIGACYVKLGEHKEAVNACTEALRDDPNYIKVLQRRAASNEQLNTWSSLSSAQEDYNTLLGLVPESSNESREVQRTLQLLKPRLEAAQKRETTEMIDKLKGVGNSILGNFGLSTDNFQFVPNGQGGYSMNFSR
ncbi:TPR-like protein [Lentinula guzmanii]|uniref:TPR-like protein n=1 Tax=Lentinula guzmanii TaxID=2804957 RepID=A0AA38JKB2_9AGAR|nr:TPR-like protein [Lentinula guzmanii]